MTRASLMRTNPTKAEAALWRALEPLGFLRQVPMALPRLKHPSRLDYYVLDFYHARRKLCIEVDGGYHRKRKGRDERRDRRLAQHGVRTLRIANAEVLDDFEATVALIRYAENPMRIGGERD